jgi:asparagine synthase (glutamine-hydrolysing)
MCGLCGLVYWDGQPVAAEVLRRMTAVLRHRGPDEEGYYQEPGVGLGFRRLSIIDLKTGSQPLSNETQDVWVVFNGEIYNFRELRPLLQAKGHVFKTATDTEVIVHGYEEWGPEVVQHLNGMFAFAVWDQRRRQLLLARDRLGIKPLFYAATPRALAFASEIKSLLLWPELVPDLNDHGVFEYFSQHFVPGDETFYRQIKKIRPGEYLVARPGSQQWQRYWQPRVQPAAPRAEADLAAELRQRLLEVVDRQLVADVPLGVFLSGGLDSSAVTAAMAQLQVPAIRSFNIGFAVKKYDETEAAELVSRHLGTTHQSFRLLDWPQDILLKLLWHLDEPMADATIMPTYLLSQMTRQQVTVALSGEGGDEIFGGYTQYQGMRLNRLLQVLPTSWRRLGVACLERLPALGPPALGYNLHRIARVLASSLYPLFEGYLHKVAFFTPAEQEELLTPEFRRQCASYPYLAALRQIPRDYPQLDPVTQANLADLLVYLPEDMLVKVDRMSMACSLEVRVPLLDHTLVEFALSLPLHLKLRGFTTKYLFRQALKPWLPSAILRRRKRGFNPPLEFWLQAHLADYAQAWGFWDALADCGYVHVPAVRRLWAEHASGRRNYSRQLWALLVFALWWRHVRGRGEWTASGGRHGA